MYGQRTRASIAIMIGLTLMATGCSGGDDGNGALEDANGADTGTDTGGNTGGGTGANSSLTVMVTDFGNERFDPQSQSGSGYGHFFNDFLIHFDRDGNFTSGLAESWEVSDDGLTWSFTIRDDATFQNGEPVTVEDVAYSLRDTFGEEAIENTTIGTIASIAQITESVEVVGDDTVEVIHSQPVPFFESLMSEGAPQYTGAIFPKEYFEDVGREGYNQDPIGAGPYRLVEHVSGQSMVFERYDDYYMEERLPPFETITLELVPELATRVQALRAGDADLVAADITVADQLEGDGTHMVMQPEGSYIWFMLPGCWNEEHACSDINVRRALDLALDKEQIMGSTYGDSWENAGWMHVTKSSLGYTEGLDPRPFDPERAQELLAEAGYPGGEGFPELTVYNARSDLPPLIPEVALQVAQQWEEVLGIPTEVASGDSDSLRTQWHARELDGEAFLRGNDTRWDGASLGRVMYDPTLDTRLAEDQRFLEMLEEAEEAITPEEREQAYEELWLELREANHTISMGAISNVWGASTKMEGWEPKALMLGPSALWTASGG